MFAAVSGGGRHEAGVVGGDDGGSDALSEELPEEELDELELLDELEPEPLEEP